MGYLLPAEYESYGLGAETSDGLVTMASALIEAHCRRPSLLAQTYVERVRVTTGCQTVRLSYGPLFAGCLTGMRVRYARPRRGEVGEMQSIGLQIATAFGLPGSWSALDVSTVDVDDGPRELTLPVNVLGIGYNEVEATYTAGFVTVPYQVKVACAGIVRNAQATPALNVQSSKLDTMQMQYFSGSLLDESVRKMLAPYVAEKLG